MDWHVGQEAPRQAVQSDRPLVPRPGYFKYVVLAGTDIRNASGELEAETIRGWMTLNIISQEFGIPLEQLYADTQLPANVSPDVMIKEIHTEYEIDFEPDIIREIVLNTGIPKRYLLKEAGLPDDVPARTALREWIFDYDRGPRDLRDVVEKYLGKKH